MDKKTSPEKLLHDLRNQLNNISMNAELAKLELATPHSQNTTNHDSAAPLACINVILETCVRCAAIADDLTAASASGNPVDSE